MCDWETEGSPTPGALISELRELTLSPHVNRYKDFHVIVLGLDSVEVRAAPCLGAAVGSASSSDQLSKRPRDASLNTLRPQARSYINGVVCGFLGAPRPLPFWPSVGRRHQIASIRLWLSASTQPTLSPSPSLQNTTTTIARTPKPSSRWLTAARRDSRHAPPCGCRCTPPERPPTPFQCA